MFIFSTIALIVLLFFSSIVAYGSFIAIYDRNAQEDTEVYKKTMPVFVSAFLFSVVLNMVIILGLIKIFVE